MNRPLPGLLAAAAVVRAAPVEPAWASAWAGSRRAAVAYLLTAAASSSRSGFYRLEHHHRWRPPPRGRCSCSASAASSPPALFLTWPLLAAGIDDPRQALALRPSPLSSRRLVLSVIAASSSRARWCSPAPWSARRRAPPRCTCAPPAAYGLFAFELLGNLLMNSARQPRGRPRRPQRAQGQAERRAEWRRLHALPLLTYAPPPGRRAG